MPDMNPLTTEAGRKQSAAPEMYQALESIENTISGLVKFNSTAVITKEQGEAILQALAKARGEQTTQP